MDGDRVSFDTENDNFGASDLSDTDQDVTGPETANTIDEGPEKVMPVRTFSVDDLGAIEEIVVRKDELLN